jgi:hypothetical protein
MFGLHKLWQDMSWKLRFEARSARSRRWALESFTVLEPGALAAPAGICAGAESNLRPYRDRPLPASKCHKVIVVRIT